MLLDDPVRDREAEARAAADGLGREEGLEDVRQRVLRDAGAVVDHLGAHRPGVAAHVRVQDDAPPGLALEHRLLGVQQEIQEHLLELVRVGEHRRQAADELLLDGDARDRELIDP